MKDRTRILAGQMAAAAALVVLAACGGGGSSPTSPGSGTASVASSGAVGTSGATITIGANGTLSPANVTIAVGQSVTFVNSDTNGHNISSDPHPSHTACPSFANLGVMPPGQTKATFGFAATGSCGFHDHNNPDSAGLKGRVTIQ